MSFQLLDFAREIALPEPENFVAKCDELRLFLEETNRCVNLTRITGKEEFDLKHVADSLTIFQLFPELLTGKFRIADIGCGAGFPSLILALAAPQLEITAIDSIGKKVAFVARAAELLGLNNLLTIHGRAVELNRKADFRNQFDIVTARAVAPSPKIYGETKNFPRKNGRFIFYKTPSQAAEEMPELLRLKNIQWQQSKVFELPENTGSRCFVIGTPR
jgi:16S rRNA (guanine527-N7)-methyltransferase